MSSEYQSRPIRVALVGLGRAMFADHYPFYREHPGLFNVVCACDIDRSRRDMVEKDYPKCKMFKRFEEMLDEPDIDLVDIATGSLGHVEYAMMSLKRGFWTLLEPPAALTTEDMMILKGQVLKTRSRLIVMHRGLYERDFLLAKQVLGDARLGPVNLVKIRKQDYIRRDDWQAVKRLGGGASYYAMPDLVFQALRLLPTPPIQMWSDLKRLVSLGDAEDYVHLALKCRDGVSAEVEYSGGVLPSEREPAFELYGEKGVFKIRAGEAVGELTMVDPKFSFPRRRSSVRTPPLEDMHEEFPVVKESIELKSDTPTGLPNFWEQVYQSVRTGRPFPITFAEEAEAVKFTHLMKKSSAFGK